MGANSEIRQSDLDRVLRLVTERYDDSLDPLPWPLLHRLRELIPCDAVAAFELDSARRSATAGQVLPDEDDDESVAEDAAFWANYWSDASCSYADRTGDTRAITKASDFYTEQQMRDSAMYQDYMRYFGSMHELMLCIPLGPGRTHRLLFWRPAGSDFTERERALLILLRPHIVAAYHDAAHRRQATPPELTARQWELLRLVAAGYTNSQIARRLGVTEGTVRKHLEHIFERMSVTNRTAAVVRAFPGGEQAG